MANQFQDMYKDTNTYVTIVFQEEHGTWKIVGPDSSLWWGGFKSQGSAGMYAHKVLGIPFKNIID